MKGLLVFDTTHGNTRAVAQAISDTLKASGISMDTLYVKDVKKLSAQDYDFLVLGSPTRFGTMSLAVKAFIGKVKPHEWANKPFAAFDTENPENMLKDEYSAAEKIAARLRERKMRQLAPVLKAAVIEMKGPLQEGELARAEEYARDIAARLKG